MGTMVVEGMEEEEEVRVFERIYTFGEEVEEVRVTKRVYALGEEVEEVRVKGIEEEVESQVVLEEVGCMGEKLIHNVARMQDWTDDLLLPE